MNWISVRFYEMGDIKIKTKENGIIWLLSLQFVISLSNWSEVKNGFVIDMFM